MFLSRTLLLMLVGVALRAEEAPTLQSNFEFRQAWGDLGSPDGITPAPTGSRRALRLTGETEELLATCKSDPKKWQRDPLIFRLAHRHATSTIGCREKASPSVHMVFYETPEGSREAWVHFDLYGPQNPVVHMSEVFRNRMTFGRTSELEVYRGLVRTKLRALPEAADMVPEPRYDLGAQATLYLHNVTGSNAISMAMLSGSTGLTLKKMMGRDTGTQTYRNRIATNLVRNAVQQSIEFGTAAFLQQEERFSASGRDGFGRRMRIALYRSFFVPGRDGEELAFPRIAAALGTPWALRQFHPGQAVAPNPWVQSAFLLARYVAKSYWAEFKPDVQRLAKRVFRR